MVLLTNTDIYVKSPSFGGRILLFYPISLLNIHLPPRSGNLPLIEPHFLPIIFSLKSELYWIFAMKTHCWASKVFKKYNNKILCIIWWVLSHYKEEIISSLSKFQTELECWLTKLVAEWFRAKSPSLARCKEGDLPLLNFSNLTCMHRCPSKVTVKIWGKSPHPTFIYSLAQS